MTGAASVTPLAITCGEPAGIGPEIAVAAWRALSADIPMVWLGDPRHLPGNTPYREIDTPAAAVGIAGDALPVLRVDFASLCAPGKPSPENAAGVIAALDRAVELVSDGGACAMVTAPINKKVLIDGAGFAYPGHTEYLAHLAGQDGRAVMMLASEQLRVVPATIHIALDKVAQTLTPDLLAETIRTTHRELTARFGIAHPRISVAGLNPHAGEGGAMGRQEIEWIADLVQSLTDEGLDVTGPWPADTMFHAAARRRYDAAVAMYHDQALIPIKTLDFDRGVNVTLGLPFIRTSPDHGTAFDIAGTGSANPTSMIEACKLAWHMAGMAARKGGHGGD